MAKAIVRDLDQPDDVQDLPRMQVNLVDLGDLTVGRSVAQPGWRWSTHIRPLVGTEWCQLRHVGLVVAGRIRIEFQDGTVVEKGPGVVYDIPPGHDGMVVGDEPLIIVEWSGSGFGPREQVRVLAAVLFTDIVGSTKRLQTLGEAGWRDLIGRHNEIVRAALARGHGREIKTTGDGFLATFDGAELAIRAAQRIRELVGELGLELRLAVHVGELELVGDDVRGLAVHETARMVELARPGEVVLSRMARDLAGASGLAFEDGGEHELRGVGRRHLYLLAATTAPSS